jgi:dipeptidyl-peptidase 4
MNFYKLARIVTVISFSVSTVVQAQTKLYTMADATNGLATTLAVKNLKYPSWQPGTDRLWQVINKDGDDLLSVVNYSSEDAETAFRITNQQLRLRGDLKQIPELHWLNNSQAYYTNDKEYILGTLIGHKFQWQLWTTLPEKAENVTVDKYDRMAYTIDNNLWLMDADGQKTQVTNEQDKNIVCGQAVHRNEFGIESGIFLSPGGHYLAYYRMDQRMVNDYPIIRWDTTPAIADIIKYPMAGGTSHQVTLCVYNPETRKTVTMETGEKEKDHYLTSVTWSPDEQYIFIGILNRDQNHLWLNQYNARTGKKVKTLFEETDPKYVHPTHPLTFLPGRGDEFIWWSERDGYEHLYLYKTSGSLIRQITKGQWVVNDLAGINIRKKELIITATRESPLEQHIYTVGLENGRMHRIDDAPGMHLAKCSEDGQYLLDMYSNATVSRKGIVRSINGAQQAVLLDAPNPLKDYDRPVVREVTLHTADGTPLYGKLILPTNFDSSKKYPVIVYLYNGPNVQLIHNSFPQSGNLWYEYMAQHGYIVFTMDGRGSWNRGLAFEQTTFRHLGDVEMHDQLLGVKYLKSLRFTDSSRFGVFGWSFGGFMTTSLMLRHPGVFKCAVAGGPVMDWKMYEVMYTERYMDRPQDNPEGYENANLLDKVKNLKGKLLLIHGTNDDVVVWQHSIDFIKKSVDEGVQVDYAVYPGHLHNVRGKDRVQLMQKITDYFEQNL